MAGKRHQHVQRKYKHLALEIVGKHLSDLSANGSQIPGTAPTAGASTKNRENNPMQSKMRHFCSATSPTGVWKLALAKDEGPAPCRKQAAGASGAFEQARLAESATPITVGGWWETRRHLRQIRRGTLNVDLEAPAIGCNLENVNYDAEILGLGRVGKTDNLLGVVFDFPFQP
jgi:hypothetical protein